ncbi:alpha/beta hydrolase [Povalibacter sp.]|uniref:alpha/beta fold hydrolase n=1 Tax=Povalibacter sp. TaxID=1962978 RepID=UPI002F3ED98A
MKNVIATIAAAGAVLTGSLANAANDRPTVVLVHGAFADASSWNGVIRILEKEGYPIVAAANPLRSVKGDAAYVSDIVASIESPVVLVGHSYGGMVISEAAKGNSNVKSLVYVAAFAPAAGETSLGLSNKFPGSTLGAAIAKPVALPGGGKDLYIQQEKFPGQFAADVAKSEARLMAATQRPIAEVALNEAASEPAWKNIPSWFVYGTQDRNIPPQAHAFMADRARSRETVVVEGSSHVVMVSHPAAVAKLIGQAAAIK